MAANPMMIEPRHGLVEDGSLVVPAEQSEVQALVGDGSHVRARQLPRRTRAQRRVEEYLRTLGLTHSERVAQVADDVVGAHASTLGEASTALAVRDVQERFDKWRAGLAASLGTPLEPLWLRAFIGAHPEAFLAEPALSESLARQFGDASVGAPPVAAHFAVQELKRARLPEWLKGLAPPAAATVAGSGLLLSAMAEDGIGALEGAWVGLFSFLFGQSAVGCATAVRGWWSSLRHARAGSLPMEASSDVAGDAALPRSAVIMPVYHESAEQVFAALAAMREELRACPGGESFELFVLSDSRDPGLAAEEERAFRRVAAAAGDTVPVYYRRRARNLRQKAGNLSEFFERWGARYEYVVVLDADSVMTGRTLVELVRRLHSSPRLGLLQAPIALSGGETLFARGLQFAASVCGPLFTTGLSRWAGAQSNYYGHNAAIRVRAFMECCELPRLKGEPPFGGNILSHDFVEAALLARGGWEVRMADDLAGSYEGLPPTLTEYVARDRRWCQGNLQHLRVAMSAGLHPMSRVHMLLGASAYLAGPAWLLFLLGAAILQGQGTFSAASGAILAACTAAVLLVPRLLGLLATVASPAARRAHGGVVASTLSFLVELVLSAALAPLLMLHHTRIVLSIVLGKAVGWGAQRRRATGGLGAAAQAEMSTTLLGVGTAGALYASAPELLPWMAPVWVPWVLAIPLSALASSPAVGGLARRLGVFSVPSEIEPEPVLLRAEELRSLTASDQAARFRDVVLDPVLLAAHIGRIRPGAVALHAGDVLDLRQRALRAGPAGLSQDEREMLLSDAEALLWLHRHAWCTWPVEAWNLARERPQVPSAA